MPEPKRWSRSLLSLLRRPDNVVGIQILPALFTPQPHTSTTGPGNTTTTNEAHSARIGAGTVLSEVMTVSLVLLI